MHINLDDNNDKTSTSKEIYNEILEEKIGEILKMSKETNRGDSWFFIWFLIVYDFKGPTPSINFGKYGGPMYIYGHVKNGEKT